MGTIAVIGSANADLVVCVGRRPEAGETILGSELVVTPGGKGANQAVAAGLIGGQVKFVGCVGSDPYGDLLRDSLAHAGVDVSDLTTVPTATGCALILITPDGENSIVVAPGANNAVTQEYLRGCEAGWARADVVVMQLEVPMAAVEYAAAACDRHGTRFVLNAAPAVLPSETVLNICDPLVVNQSEALILLDEPRGTGLEPERLVRRLLEMGPRSVVLTLGAAGSVCIDRAGVLHRQPARPVITVDTTGAGDAFVGALAKALAAGQPLAAGLETASDVAALAVQRRGAQSSYPTSAALRQP